MTDCGLTTASETENPDPLPEINETFETTWIIDGREYKDLAEVTTLVEAGAIAVEITAERKRRDAQQQRMREGEQYARLRKIAEMAADAEHRQSPDGQREAALRTAAANPGGIVSSGASQELADLESYGPARTNLLR